MGERSGYDDGVFCWVELSTTDAAAAKEFYGALLGWEYDDMPVGEDHVYSMATVKGKHVAALQKRTQEGVPPNWMNYVAVGDADAAAAKAAGLGGNVMAPPFDVMDAGRMAVLADPQGAVFGLWQAGNHFGAQLVNEEGALTLNQLSTSDLDAAEKFYADLFGWTAETMSEEPRFDSLRLNGRMNGGAAPLFGAPVPNWMPYFTHADLDAAVAQIGQSGGNVISPPMPVPQGRFTVAQDPQGAFFALWQGEVDP